MNQEDTKLVAEAKQTPEAFEKLYTKYANKVFNYFWYRTGHDTMVAEDLMQETFLRAFQHVQRFNIRGYSYLTYLMTIAHNVLVDHYRKPTTLPYEAAEHMPYEIVDEYEKRSDAEALWRAVSDLPQGSRDTLLMRYQQNMSIRDIAKATGSSENAIKLSLSRTRSKLRRHPYLRDIRSFKDAQHTHTEPRFLAHA